MLALEPLPGPFGRAVRGLDLSRDLDDETFRALAEALYAHRLLVLADQRLDRAAFLAFGRRWGQPIPHVLDHLRMPGWPDLLEIGNVGPNAKEEANRNGAAFWHTDQSYDRAPATATMLYSLRAPVEGGETRVADCKAAYDDLDAATRARIDGLEALHFYGAGAGDAGERRAAPLISRRQADEVPPTRHRLARPHSVTGEKALYAVAGTAYGIDGMAEDEAQALLAGLKRHVTQDRYVYAHKYAVGDVAIWDTQMTLHCATPIGLPDGPASERQLWRVSVRGKPPLFH